jgi:hypothetical protein
MPSEDDARARLLKIIDDAKTFDELDERIQDEYATKSGVVFGAAVRFLAESDPSGLDASVQERFAQALSRMVDSEEALRLAAILES